MGFHWLPHTSLLTCTKTRKLYFQYHWFAAEFHCLAVGYTWLRCTKKFEGHIVPPNCSYSIIGPSLWIFSAAVGVARPQPLLPLEAVPVEKNSAMWRNLALTWRKIEQKILPVEKKGQIWSMRETCPTPKVEGLSSFQALLHRSLTWFGKKVLHNWTWGSPCSCRGRWVRVSTWIY